MLLNAGTCDVVPGVWSVSPSGGLGILANSASQRVDLGMCVYALRRAHGVWLRVANGGNGTPRSEHGSSVAFIEALVG